MKATALKRWYANKPAIITLLVIFFPVGLFLMWKFSNWSLKTRWVVTCVVALLIAVGLTGSYNAPPSIIVSNTKNNTINTDNAEYVLEGSVSSMKDATFSIDGQSVELSESHDFSHSVQLEQGDNVFSMVAVNENGETKETITVHRTTQAEFVARTEAERLVAKEKAEKEEKKVTEAKTKNAEKPKKDTDKKSGFSWRWPSFKWPFGKSDDEKAKDKAETDRIAKEEAEAEAKKPKHSYDDFYKWVNTYIKTLGHGEPQRWAYIDGGCTVSKRKPNNDLVTFNDKACLQEQYKEYIQQGAFDAGTSKNGDTCSSDVEGYYHYLCSRFGDMLEHIRLSSSYGVGFKGGEEQAKAKAIYKEIARTKG